jgi:small subunit ribosomal protein S1
MLKTATKVKERVSEQDVSFADMLDESLGKNTGHGFEGAMMRGTVLRVTHDFVVIDIGLKSEGFVPLREFYETGNKIAIKQGDVVDLIVDRYENQDGSVTLSREKARREEVWASLEKALANKEAVEGVITGRIKGGFNVDISGAQAFMPGSQVDMRGSKDVSVQMFTKQFFQIIKMDRQRGNIVVSRRSETVTPTRDNSQAVKEGAILDGVVKNLTDYGAFIDLGGIDGLLHVTDIAWRRLNHPSDALVAGQQVRVQVIKYNAESNRISLGMKQLLDDPWVGVAEKYTRGMQVSGRVTNITDYGAFVEIEHGVEGLIHVSEMSWTKKDQNPGKFVSTSQEVDVIILDIDSVKRRISLGLKQVQGNPWELFATEHPVGTDIEGEIRNITEFGVFIAVTDELDGMVHLSDLSWTLPSETAVANYLKGDIVKARIMDIDPVKERVGLSVKHLTADPAATVLNDLKSGATINCKVTSVQANGIEVEVAEGLTAFIRKGELAREKSEQRPERFKVGELIEARVTTINRETRQVQLTIRGRELEEDKKALADFGNVNSDSGASLGDILGAAIRRRNRDSEV